LLYNPPATPQSYPLSLHDALPILAAKQLVRPLATEDDLERPPSHGRHDEGRHGSRVGQRLVEVPDDLWQHLRNAQVDDHLLVARSEEHTSELQSRENLVCRLLLEK